MQFFDTHCHIHFADYGLDPEEVIARAKGDDVTRLLCVGCTLEDSVAGIKFAREHENVWATIGLHPHEAVKYVGNDKLLAQFSELANDSSVIAIGETGLDYFYEHSPKDLQKKLLRFQLDTAQKHDLPLVFHIRDAFEDFWKIFDEYNNLRGVIHSFSATNKQLNEALQRGLYIGLNGIMTFTKNEEQLLAAKTVPIDRLVLETDAPFLTPVPFRGKICEPKHVRTTASFLADLRGESLELIAATTTSNAQQLFSLSENL